MFKYWKRRFLSSVPNHFLLRILLQWDIFHGDNFIKRIAKHLFLIWKHNESWRKQVVSIWLSNGQLMAKLMIKEIKAWQWLKRALYRDTRKERRFGFRKCCSRFLLIENCKLYRGFSVNTFNKSQHRVITYRVLHI